MTQELRKLAEAATQGKWTSENLPRAGIQMRVPYKGTTRMTFTEVFRQLPEKEWDAELWANAEYIAAANPSAILALLDRLEKAEKDAERLLPLLKQAHSVVEGSYSEEYDQGFEEIVSAALFTEIQAMEASK